MISEQEILAGFSEIVEEYTNLPASEITLESDLVQDLAIDSLSMVEIVMAAQDKFSVEIPDEILKELKTVRNVVNFVQRSRVSA